MFDNAFIKGSGVKTPIKGDFQIMPLLALNIQVVTGWISGGHIEYEVLPWQLEAKLAWGMGRYNCGGGVDITSYNL